ncbi:MAG TPA: MFS transporter [Nocardioides sp.]|nr:MFS transporter [Nocardioides sp.]
MGALGGRRALDAVVPPRLGTGFRWLLASTWVTSAGDGLALAAGPLLVASQSDNAILVSMAALLQRLPWLVFGLYAGAIADRLDRRLLVVVCDGLRAVVLAVLSVTIITGAVNIAVVLVAMFLMGLAEVFSDTATRALLPMLVDRDDLGIGNARLQTGFIAMNQLLGPSLGAVLFAAGMALPFVTQTVCVALGVLLVSRIRTAPGVVTPPGERHLRRDIAEGIRWLMDHAAVRTLAVVMFTFNVTFGAAWSVMVLYATRHLGMSEAGYGLLATSAAIGGIVSTTGYGWLERHVSLAALMRTCLTLEVLLHLAFAVNTSPVAAIVLMFVFGAYAFVWNTVASAVRQRATPMEFQGRVGSAYSVGLYGGLVIGLALGGVIAHQWGLTAPFWFAFVGSGITLALLWRSLGYVAHADRELPSAVG